MSALDTLISSAKGISAPQAPAPNAKSGGSALDDLVSTAQMQAPAPAPVITPPVAKNPITSMSSPTPTIQTAFPSLTDADGLLGKGGLSDTERTSMGITPNNDLSLHDSTPMTTKTSTENVAKEIGSALVSIPTQLVKGIYTQETAPNADEKQLESTLPGGSSLLGNANTEGIIGATTQDLSIPAKLMTRFFAPLLQGAGQNIADAILANSKTARSTFNFPDSMIPSLPSAKQTVLQGVGNFMQLAFAAATPEVGTELGLTAPSEDVGNQILKTLATNSGKDAFAPLATIIGKQAVASGIHGAEAGLWFGTAQAFSSGETDPAKVAGMIFKSSLGLGLLGAVLGAGKLGSDIATTALTKNIIDNYNLPSSVYVSADKINEYVNTGTLTDPQAKELFDKIGGLGELQAQAKEQGTNINTLRNTGAFFQIPISDAIEITDKPWFAKIKEAFGVQPSPTEAKQIIQGKPDLSMRKQLPAPSDIRAQLDSGKSPEAVTLDVAHETGVEKAKELVKQAQELPATEPKEEEPAPSTPVPPKSEIMPALGTPVSEDVLDRTPAQYQGLLDTAEKSHQAEIAPLNEKVTSLEKQVKEAKAGSQEKKSLRQDLVNTKRDITSKNKDFSDAIAQHAKGLQIFMDNHLQTEHKVPLEKSSDMATHVLSHITEPNLVEQHAHTSLRDIANNVANEKDLTPEDKKSRLESTKAHMKDAAELIKNEKKENELFKKYKKTMGEHEAYIKAQTEANPYKQTPEQIKANADFHYPKDNKKMDMMEKIQSELGAKYKVGDDVKFKGKDAKILSTLYTENDNKYELQVGKTKIWTNQGLLDKENTPAEKPKTEVKEKTKEKPVKKGEKFYTTHGKDMFKEVEGKRVEIDPKLDTFIHKTDGRWTVSETTSGLKIGEGNTQALAIADAKQALIKGVEKSGKSIEKIVSDAVEKTGLSPASGGKLESIIAPMDKGDAVKMAEKMAKDFAPLSDIINALTSGNKRISISDAREIATEAIKDRPKGEDEKILKARADIAKAKELMAKAPEKSEDFSVQTKSDYQSYIDETQHYIDQKIASTDYSAIPQDAKIPKDKVKAYKELASSSKTEDEFIATLHANDIFNDKNAREIKAGKIEPKIGIKDFDIPTEAYRLSQVDRTRLREGVKWTPEEALAVVRSFFTPQETEFIPTDKPIKLGMMREEKGTIQGLAYQGFDVERQEFRSYIKVLSEGGKLSDGVVLHEVFEKAVQIAFDEGVFGKVTDKVIKNPLSILLRDPYSRDVYDTRELRAKETLSDDFAEWYRDQKGYGGENAGLWEKLLQFVRQLWRRITGADKLYEDLTNGVRMKDVVTTGDVGMKYGLSIRENPTDPEARAREFYRAQQNESVAEKVPTDVQPKTEKPLIEKTEIDPREMIDMQKEIEKTKPMGGFKTALKEISTLFNPVGKADARAVDVLMNRKGEYERALFRTEQTMRAVKNMWDKQPEEARLDFMDKVETGQTSDIAPALRPLADMYKTRLDNAYKQITQFKNINFLENFFPHFWEDPTAVEKANLYGKLNARRPLQGSKPFTKERVFDTIKQGVDAGYKLTTSNPEELMQIYEQNVQKFSMANNIKQDMLDRGFWKTVRTGDKPPTGFTKIEDSIAKVYLNPNIPILEAYDEIATNKLNDIIQNLGINNDRKYNLGRGKAGVLGFTNPKDNTITTKFGAPLSVTAHELGHQLDFKYGLKDIFIDQHATVVTKELRALADLRYEGHNVTGGYKDYIRSAPEKMAVMLEALIHAPEKFKEIAPTVYQKFTSFIASHEELKPLLDVKPSLVLGVREDSVYAGGAVLGAEHYAQEDVARLINNFLSKDNLMDTALGKGIMNVKNTMNAFELGFSAFHMTMETFDTIITKFAVGLGKISQGNLGGLWDMGTSIAAPFSYFNTGRKFYNSDPEMMKIEKDIFAGGASLRDKQYYKNSVFDTFMQKNREILGDLKRGDTLTGLKKTAVQLLRTPLAAVEATMRPMFTYYIPRLKVGAFQDLFSAELQRNSQKIQDGKITRAEVARNVWNNIENRMGELNYDNLFWKRNLKTSLMLTTRAVGWNLGTGREIGGGVFQDLPKSFGFTKESREDFKKYGFDFTPKMGYVMSLFFILAATDAIYQFLHTGKYPGQNDDGSFGGVGSALKDLYYPRNGAKTKAGQDARVSMPTYLKDIVQSGIPSLLTGHPFQAADNFTSMMKNKAAPELTTIIDLLNNSDFLGNEIRNPHDNNTTQAKQVAVYLMSQFEPFSVQQQQNLAAGKSTIEQQAEAFFGIIAAPAAVVQSAYDAQLQALYEDQSGGFAPETPEQAAAQAQKSQVVSQIKKGDYSGVQGLLNAGIIKPRGLEAFIKNALLTTPQKEYKGLSPENKAKLKP